MSGRGPFPAEAKGSGQTRGDALGSWAAILTGQVRPGVHKDDGCHDTGALLSRPEAQGAWHISAGPWALRAPDSPLRGGPIAQPPSPGAPGPGTAGRPAPGECVRHLPPAWGRSSSSALSILPCPIRTPSASAGWPGGYPGRLVTNQDMPQTQIPLVDLNVVLELCQPLSLVSWPQEML